MDKVWFVYWTYSAQSWIKYLVMRYFRYFSWTPTQVISIRDYSSLSDFLGGGVNIGVNDSSVVVNNYAYGTENQSWYMFQETVALDASLVDW